MQNLVKFFPGKTSSDKDQKDKNVPKLGIKGFSSEPNFSPVLKPTQKAAPLSPTILGQDRSSLPFLLSEKWKTKSEAILNWVRNEIREYDGIVINGVHSFVTGEPFLALLNKFDPTLVDVNCIQLSDPEATLSLVFSLAASSALCMPNLLEPKDVMSNRDPQSLLLYLELWRHKVEKFREHPVEKVRKEVAMLINLVEENSAKFQGKSAEFDEACTVLWASSHNEALKEERMYLDQRAKVMDDMLYEISRSIDTLEMKNSHLEEENRNLMEKLEKYERELHHEEGLRKREELKLKVEEQMRAMGEVIEEKSVEDYLKKFEKVEGTVINNE